ncbi:MAG: hypothetical protein A2014_00245 [Spirochaetes bacterium GWF1_49_6]|nr:MAG: hypothetical protein A2014_00245 [Spirochaetes bacterium GWF1_49_6]
MKKIIAFFIFSMVIGSLYGLSDVKVELQFFTQTYRLNDPIPVMVNVVNTSKEKFQFDVSSLIYETFFFEVKTPKNEDIVINDLFQIEMKNNYSSSEDYRKITLNSGESFSKTIDINQWYQVKDSGYYFIKGVFYPNPDDKSKKLESVYYKILVKPPLMIESDLIKEEQAKTAKLNQVKLLPPYEVVADMIDAKMKKDWDRFLIHIDAERLINSFDNYALEYKNAKSGQYALEVLERFRQYLTVYWQDIVESYSINKSTIEGDKAQVECDIRYLLRNVSYDARYTFILYKNHNGEWLVEDYIVHMVK